MSDYVHQKVVRLPFPKAILDKCETDDPWECETHLKELLGNLFNNREKNSFELTFTDTAYYLDWVYYSTYGDESGDWGHVRYLTDKEFEVIEPMFEKLCVPFTKEELRLVDYCYYNCCEPSDYYEVKQDESSKFIN